VSDWDEIWTARAGQFRRWPNEELIRFLSRIDKGVVLEVGCGNGANLWAIADEGFEAHGIDISPVALQLCEVYCRIRRQRVQLEAASATALPYPDATFDAVVDVVALQHLTQVGYNRAFAEVARVLKPSGWWFSTHIIEGAYAEVFPGLGPICAPVVAHDQFDIEVETVTKTYGAGMHQICYAVVTGRRLP
jgi:ubiquinone/menaquinone biosynthesis C-methylase UbiE